MAHQRLHVDATFGEQATARWRKAIAQAGGEIVEQLGVGEAGVVVDHHVQVLEAGRCG